MSFCSKCGNQLNDGVKFCHNCGNQVNGSKSISITIHKNAVIIVAVLVVLGITILAFALKDGTSKSIGSNTQDRSNNLQEQTPAGELTNDKGTKSDQNYVGNSEVTYEVKDGVNYYTSSDKKWTVEENSFIAYFNEEKIEVGAVFKYVNYSSGAWSSKIKLAPKTFLTFFISTNIPNMKHGRTFTLSEMGKISFGDPIQVYIVEEDVLAGQHLNDDYYLSTAYTPEENTDYQRAFDTCELRIDCYDRSKGII